jgi:hypothetical protein
VIGPKRADFGVITGDPVFFIGVIAEDDEHEEEACEDWRGAKPYLVFKIRLLAVWSG